MTSRFLCLKFQHFWNFLFQGILCFAPVILSPGLFCDVTKGNCDKVNDFEVFTSSQMMILVRCAFSKQQFISFLQKIRNLLSFYRFFPFVGKMLLSFYLKYKIISFYALAVLKEFLFRFCKSPVLDQCDFTSLVQNNLGTKSNVFMCASFVLFFFSCRFSPNAVGVHPAKRPLQPKTGKKKLQNCTHF